MSPVVVGIDNEEFTLLECYVDNERVRPQTGGFYGGWITHKIVGLVKGNADTASW